MSTIQENIAPGLAAPSWRRSVLSDALRFACSVRLGVTLLCLLGLACLIGMLVMQQNVDGFENYYAALTPAQRLLYGKLGFFNIYHVWYFNALLCLLSLNIILASIDRFPKTWKYVSKPTVVVPFRWLSEQRHHDSFTTSLTEHEFKSVARHVMREHGLRRTHIAKKGDREYLLGESGVWNRLGAYPVHVALLTIFLGGFLTAQLGTTGNLPLAPGESSNLISETVVDLDRVNELTKKLPFEVTFTDIEQRLIKKEGPLTAGNTLDWITRFQINDEGQIHEGSVQMNQPFDYRGYRFFQASFVSVGRARNITIDVTPAGTDSAQRLNIDRDGSATLPDGTRIRFAEFRGNFRIGPDDPNEDTTAYPNPAAVLNVTQPGGSVETVYVFGPQMANIPVASKPVAGYTYRLVDFEKVSDRHILSVQRDPGSDVVYVGFSMLFITLVAVFFFSHRRVWILKDGETILVAGNVNRNQNGFDDTFARLAADLRTAVGRKENL